MGTWSGNKYLPTNNGFKYFNGFSPVNTLYKNIQNRVWYENDTIIKNPIKDSFIQIKNCALNIIEKILIIRKIFFSFLSLQK